MNIRSSMPPRASVIAFSFGIRSAIDTSVSLMKILPLTSTESCSGVLSCSRLFAWVCGRSSGTPTVKSGADTMKMINSTSITSTMGVTLISAMTALRPLRRPPPPEAPMFMPMIWCSPPLPPYDTADSRPLSGAQSYPKTGCHLSGSCPLVDLAREDRRKLVRKALQPLGLPVHLGDEFIIENCRRNCGDQADCGGKQGIRDARGDHRQGGVFRGRDRLEARHDAP